MLKKFSTKFKAMGKASSRKCLTENSSKKSSKNTSYKVRKGDSLDAIAKRFNLEIQDIKQLNKLVSNKIIVGQKLVLN